MSAQPKRLVVIGGVAAGTKTAAKARREDPSMEITILTDEPYISYAACGLPYYIGGLVKRRNQLLERTPAYFKERENIEILTRHRVTHIDPEAKQVTATNLETQETRVFPYDTLVVATGAEPLISPIKGRELENIFTLRSPADAIAMRDVIEQQAPKEAVIVGAGLIGLEVAENFALHGLRVTVVELLDQAVPPLDKDMAELVEKHLKEKGVTLLLSEEVKAFESKDGKRVSDVVTNKRTLPADIVLLSVGIRPQTQLAADAGIELGVRKAIRVNDRLQTNISSIYAVGDCAEVRHLVTKKPAWIPLGSTANKQGRVAGVNVAGGDECFEGVVGTLIVKVFDLTVGKTGLSEKEAQAEGINYDVALVPTSDIAHYYPNHKQMTIKLVGEKGSGRLLGAQIVGQAGVDKRIDVVATALAFRSTVEQLSKLDLAYAPPYASAMDAIIVAANVLRSKLEQKVEGVTPAQFRKEQGEDCLLLDVRNVPEYWSGIIPGAKCIPLPELPKRLEELDKTEPIVAYCDSGWRSAKAYRILKQAGFKQVRNMDGGIRMWHYGLEVQSERKPQRKRDK
jgi:NADPH-dependent 2,4-dienoyl-CoA reductase/sulfur reductase-like enzyme/rhodanese-related sulfurtransferase